MNKLYVWASLVWAILFGIIPEDTRYFCALMAVLFALFYIGDKK